MRPSLSLALGIGATVSAFSLIYSVFMNPWPYQGADRIANVALLDKSGEGQGYGLNGPQTRELAEAKSREYVMGFNAWNLTVTGSDVPEDVQAMYFTAMCFRCWESRQCWGGTSCHPTLPTDRILNRSSC